MSFVQVLKDIILRPKSPDQIEELEDVEMLVLQGKLEQAFEKVEEYEKSNPFKTYQENEEFYQIKNQILKSKILGEIGKREESLELAQETLNRANILENEILTTSSMLVIAENLLATGKINESTDLIDEAELRINAIKRRYKDVYKTNYATLNFIKGKIYRQKGEFDKAIESLTTSIELREMDSNPLSAADPLNVVGIVYATKGDVENSLLYLNRSLDLFNQVQNEIPILKLNNNIGLLHMNSGNIDLAIDYFDRAYEMSEKIGNKQYSGTIKLNIGQIYSTKGDFSRALSNLEESKVIFEEIGLKPGLAVCLMNIGTIYNVQGDYDAALQYTNDSLVINKELDTKPNIANCYNNLGHIYLGKGENDKAIDYYIKSSELYEGIGVSNEFARALFSVIQGYVSIDQIDKAEPYLEKIEQIRETKSNKLIEHVYKLAKASILIESERFFKRAEALFLFQEIADDEVINQDYTIEAMLKLGDLLLQEIKLTASEEALGEFKELIGKLSDLTSGSDMSATQYPTMVQVILLKSKLALIDLNMEEAQKLLKEAIDISTKQGLEQFRQVAQAEQDRLKNELMKYKKMVDTNASLYDRLQQTQIEDYLAKARNILRR